MKVVQDVSAQGGFFNDLWAMIVERLTAPLGTYINLGLTERAVDSFRIAVIAFFCAIIIGAIVVCFRKNVYGGLVERMNAEAVWSPEKAKTLKELGYDRNSAVKTALKLGKQYKDIVRCVEEDAYNENLLKIRRQNAMDYAEGNAKSAAWKAPSFVFDFETNHFYIPESKSIEAEAHFERKGSGLALLLVIIPVTLIALFLALVFLPDILRLVDNFIGNFKG